MRITPIALFVLSLSSAVHASIIGGPTGSSNVTVTGGVVTIVPGNNEAPGNTSPNTINISETGTATGLAMQVSFDIVAEPNPPRLSTEYSVDKLVLNDTQDTWSSFSLALSWIMFTGQAAAGNSAVVSFDGDSFPLLSGYGAATTVTTNQAIWSNLNILPGQSFHVIFAVDTCASCSGIWQMLQQAGAAAPNPTGEVPEAGTLALVGIALIGLASRARLRR